MVNRQITRIKGELDKVITQAQIEKQTEFEEAARVRQQLFNELMNLNRDLNTSDQRSTQDIMQ